MSQGVERLNACDGNGGDAALGWTPFVQTCHGRKVIRTRREASIEKRMPGRAGCVRGTLRKSYVVSIMLHEKTNGVRAASPVTRVVK